MKKRILAMALGFLVGFTSVPEVSFAAFLDGQGQMHQEEAEQEKVRQEETEEQQESENQQIEGEMIFINPLYDAVVTEDDLLPLNENEEEVPAFFSLEEGQSCTSVEEAGELMREYLKARVSDISIQYEAAEVLGNEGLQEIFDYAVQHTGNGSEGDYINWQYAGWQAGYEGYSQDGMVYLTLNYTVTYYTTAEQEEAVDEKVDQVLAELNLNGKSDYQKIKAVYDYVCSHVTYDYDNLNDDGYKLKYTAYAALINGTSVCQGYANLIYRLLLEEGVDTRFIGGTSNGENHAWNIAKSGDYYYYLDATWDAGREKYSYFLKGENNFEDHQAEEYYLSGEFASKYVISETDAVDTGGGVNIPEAVEGDFTYKVVDGEAYLLSYHGEDEELLVPSELGGYPLVMVCQGAFQSNGYLKSITFGEGLKSMGTESLSYCRSLEAVYFPSTLNIGVGGNIKGLGGVIVGCEKLATIGVSEENQELCVYDGAVYTKDMGVLILYPAGDTREVFRIPDGVKSIEDDACAYNMHVKEIIMPDTVTYIGYWAFCNDDSLERINISKGCEFIGQFAISNTKLKSLHIPASVMSIGTISGNKLLEEITVDENNPNYYSEDGILYSATALVSYPLAKKSESYEMKKGILRINDDAFAGAEYLKRIIFSDTLQSIGNLAISGCSNLEEIIVDEGNLQYQSYEGVLYSGTDLILYPEAKKSEIFQVKNGIQDIGEMAFENTKNIKKVVLPESVNTIDHRAFNNSAIEEIELPLSIKEIGNNAFSGCNNLKSVNYAGNDEQWEKIFIGSGNEELLRTYGKFTDGNFIYEKIYGKAYLVSYNGDDEELVMPASLGGYPLVKIYRGAFKDCKALKSIIFSEGLVEVQYGFIDWYSCQNLKSVYLPASLKINIGAWDETFRNAEEISVSEDNDTICMHEGAIYTKDMKQLLHYSKTDEREVFQIPEGVEIIGIHACFQNEFVKEIIMPDTVIEIGYGAFSGDMSLEKINISEKCERIYGGALFRTKVAAINIPASVTYISERALSNSVLEEINVDDSNEIYHSYKGVLYTDEKVIQCPEAKKADVYEIQNGISCIGENAFRVRNIKKVVVPNTVTVIEDGAFMGAEIEEIDLPAAIERIGNFAFSGCNNLKNIGYDGSEEEWMKIEIGSNNEVLDMQRNHTWNEGQVLKEALCAEEGEIKYICSVCGREKTDIIEALGHAYNAEYTIDRGATCTEPGSRSRHCQRCDDRTDIQEIPAAGHKETEVRNAKEATCVESGYTGDIYCKVCGTEVEHGTEIEPSGHPWDEGKIITEASCTEAGETQYICTVCKETRTEPIEALGHVYNAEYTIDKRATCTEPGSRSRHCQRCNEKTDIQEIPATGHIWDEGKIIKEATCTEAGEKQYICTVCSETDVKEIKAPGHDWQPDYTTDQQPTCTAEGSKSIHCKKCDAVKGSEPIPAAGHTFNPAAWETNENSHYHTCSVCQEKDTAEPHLFAWITDKEATEAAVGLKHEECSVCGFKRSENTVIDKIIPSHTHTYETITQKATTAQDGSIVTKCTGCGNITSSVAIPRPVSAVLTNTDFTYTGKEIQPGITVTDSTGAVIPAANYTVTYTDNKNVGTAAVQITFGGNYSGIMQSAFIINPKGTALQKLTSKAKGFTVKWKKQKTQTTGYEIQYSTSKKFTAKTTFIKTVKKASAQKLTVNKLKAGKKYFARIRTYKTVNGKKYYSSWSKAKDIKTKK